MTRWNRHWQFETARFIVCFETTPCDTDPVDSFEFQEDIDAVRNDQVLWFDARVRVFLHDPAYPHLDGAELGTDYLGGCAYNTIREFTQSHWRSPWWSRNCTAMRDAYNAYHGTNKICICDYFPSMVRCAIDNTRTTLRNMPKLRTAA